MGSKKKLLFVINTMSKAGAEISLLELFSHIDTSRYEVDLFVLMAQGELMPQVPSFVNVINKKVDGRSVHSKEGVRGMVKRILSCCVRQGSVFKNFPYLLVNSVSMLGAKNKRPENLMWRVVSDGAERIDKHYDLAVAYLEGGSTYYVADHISADKKAAFVHVDYNMVGYNPKLDGDAYSHFDMVFVPSEDVKKSFIMAYEDYRDRVDVFENYLDTDRIKKLAAEGEGFSDDYDGVRLLTVARLTPQKGYNVAIDAMAELKSRGVRARWYAAGNGKLKDELLKQIGELGLEEDFILLDRVENPYGLMRDCDIYVHATLYEGRSIAIREAKAVGCAVITTDVPGNRDAVVDGETGVLCGTGATAIADAIERVINDRELAERISEGAARDDASHEDEINKLYSIIGGGSDG